MKICKKFAAFEHRIVFVTVSELTKLFRNNNKKQILRSYAANFLQISANLLKCQMMAQLSKWNISLMEIKLHQNYNFLVVVNIPIILAYHNSLNSNNSIISWMQQHFRSKCMKIIYGINLFWYLQNLKFPQS